MKHMYRLLLLAVVLLKHADLHASHLIVGEMTYKHIGSQQYEFTVYYYRDCRSTSQGGGNPAALVDDDPLYITVYENGSFFSFDSITSSAVYQLPFNNLNNCLLSNIPQCINVMQVQFTMVLPNSAATYTILNQRCCLNGSISNILNPGMNGNSFYCVVPPSSVHPNSSAEFKPVSNLLMCTNKKYVIDHSATDPDGDSLSYEICETDLGGSPDASGTKPRITSGNLPVFQHPVYVSPYSAGYPMPGLSLNASTGEMLVNTNLQGSYLVTVCCHEWRSGVMINTIKRTYTYTVQNCNFSISADIACDSHTLNATNGKICVANCNDKTIHFKNNSVGATQYHWDFGDLTVTNDTSDIAEPTFTYSDTGMYKVTLIVYGATCIDSVSEYVTISNDQIDADFTMSGQFCTGDSIQFSGTATSANDIIKYYEWNFAGPHSTTYSYQQHPNITFSDEGQYHVFFNAFNSKGCYATVEKDMQLTSINVSAYSDTIAVKGTSVNFYANGADTYNWTYRAPNNAGLMPYSTQQNIQFIDNKEGVYMFYVTGMNSEHCTGKDSVQLIYSSKSTVFVPNVFSPNHDGLNDQVKPFLIGYTLKWFKIYNRRGQQMFFTSDPQQGWDGIFKGKEMGMDTYYWAASVLDGFHLEHLYKGDLILMR